MTISERVFSRLESLGMSQREFSERTGIRPSTISEWKKKGTNPSSEKIMPICEALQVTPEWLLSGIDATGNRARNHDYYTVPKETETGHLIEQYNSLNQEARNRILGYVEAFAAMKKE